LHDCQFDCIICIITSVDSRHKILPLQHAAEMYSVSSAELQSVRGVSKLCFTVSCVPQSRVIFKHFRTAAVWAHLGLTALHSVTSESVAHNVPTSLDRKSVNMLVTSRNSVPVVLDEALSVTKHIPSTVKHSNHFTILCLKKHP